MRYGDDLEECYFRDCPHQLLNGLKVLMEPTELRTEADVHDCYVEPEEHAEIFLLMSEAVYLDFR